MFLKTIWTIFILLLFCQPVWAKTIKVALLPIDMAAAGKYQYLGGSIKQMLATRLSDEGEVEIVDSSLSKKQLDDLAADGKGVANIFKKLNADYIGSGYCYETLDGMKLQMSFFSNIENNPVNVTMLAKSEDEIISNIDELAEKIHQDVLGFETESLADATAGSGGLGAFQTAHPEKAYKLGVYSGVGAGGEGSGSLVSIGVKNSVGIDLLITAMDRGDLDGDGDEELVVISETKLLILKLYEERLRVVQRFNLGIRYKAHVVNLADLDGDGRAEMYISGNDLFTPSSRIYEWSEQGGLQIVEERISWYIRPVVNGRQRVLLGQRSSRNKEDDFLAKGIHELKRDSGNGRLVGGKRFPLPDNINLFDFIQADINGDNLVETIAIDRNEKMLVYEASNELIWVSDGEYGGSLTHFGPTRVNLGEDTPLGAGGMNSEQLLDSNYVFIPTRMIAADVDSDGQDEIIVGRNQYEGVRYLPNMRSYSGGTVACLKWDGGAMDELWKTRRYPGYVADYSFLMTGKETQLDEGGVASQGRLLVGYAEEVGFLGFSFSDKSKVETFTFEVEKKNKLDNTLK